MSIMQTCRRCENWYVGPDKVCEDCGGGKFSEGAMLAEILRRSRPDLRAETDEAEPLMVAIGEQLQQQGRES